jgi:hypothetical protein
VRWILGVVGVLAIAAIGLFALVQYSLSTMFLAEDADSYDPGLTIGEQFPAIHALHEGREISGIDLFMRDKGAVFLATRSVDW